MMENSGSFDVTKKTPLVFKFMDQVIFRKRVFVVRLDESISSESGQMIHLISVTKAKSFLVYMCGDVKKEALLTFSIENAQGQTMIHPENIKLSTKFRKRLHLLPLDIPLIIRNYEPSKLSDLQDCNLVIRTSSMEGSCKVPRFRGKLHEKKRDSLKRKRESGSDNDKETDSSEENEFEEVEPEMDYEGPGKPKRGRRRLPIIHCEHRSAKYSIKGWCQKCYDRLRKTNPHVLQREVIVKPIREILAFNTHMMGEKTCKDIEKYDSGSDESKSDDNEMNAVPSPPQSDKYELDEWTRRAISCPQLEWLQNLVQSFTIAQIAQ